MRGHRWRTYPGLGGIEVNGDRTVGMQLVYVGGGIDAGISVGRGAELEGCYRAVTFQPLPASLPKVTQRVSVRLPVAWGTT